jgi:uncharacterized protein
MESICSKVCKYEKGTNVCVGCGRTSEEITEWFYATDERKREIVRMAKDRKNKDYIVIQTNRKTGERTEKIMYFSSFITAEDWCAENSTEYFKYEMWTP